MKLLLSLLTACATAAAAAAPPPAPLGCLIEPYRTADVGSPVVGVIENVLVDRGDRVTKGQALAVLRADVERQSVAVAEGRALAMGELRAAEANAELARQKLARAVDLAKQEFISSQALEQARAEALVAENRLTQAREQRDIYAREHELARAQLGLRTIRSPSNGIVADRFLSPGERVEEKPIFRVAVVDPLRVEVVLPAPLFTQVKRGMTMLVQPEFPGAQARRARVVLVDQLLDGASNTFRARLELPNADQPLPAGLRCKAELSDVELAIGKPPARPALADPGQLQLRIAPGLGSTPAARP